MWTATVGCSIEITGEVLIARRSTGLPFFSNWTGCDGLSKLPALLIGES